MNPELEVREHEGFGYCPAFGRTTVEIECPFCKCVVVAYVWSLAGSGKKCPECGAIHTGRGVSWRRKAAADAK